MQRYIKVFFITKYNINFLLYLTHFKHLGTKSHQIIVIHTVSPCCCASSIRFISRVSQMWEFTIIAS